MIGIKKHRLQELPVNDFYYLFSADYCIESEFNVFIMRSCPCGGTGRRDRLKICCPLGCAGSIPAKGTTLEDLSWIGRLR